jgi:hypothetical protein
VFEALHQQENDVALDLKQKGWRIVCITLENRIPSMRKRDVRDKERRVKEPYSKHGDIFSSLHPRDKGSSRREHQANLG